MENILNLPQRQAGRDFRKDTARIEAERQARWARRFPKVTGKPGMYFSDVESDHRPDHPFTAKLIACQQTGLVLRRVSIPSDKQDAETLSYYGSDDKAIAGARRRRYARRQWHIGTKTPAYALNNE